MLAYWVLLPVLLLHAADIRAEQSDPRSFNSVDTSLQRVEDDGYPEHDGIRRYECPPGFFRLRRSCYYLSGGTEPWREAHFACTSRNATLAVLNRNGKDKKLRKYLMGDQFRRLERWIGGIYNWRQMSWEWGGSGDKVLFQNFGNPDTSISKNYAYHCIVLDPMMQYKWNARNCIEKKYYICEVPAGRIGKSRRRKNITDPNAPQSQRLRPRNKDEYRRNQRRQRTNRLKSMRKKNWYLRDDNQVWAHGIKPGSRPPKRYTPIKRPKISIRGKNKVSRHNLKHPELEPRISQVTPRPGEFGAFPADGRPKPDEYLQSLSNEEVVFPRLLNNDFTHEEILLKI